MPDAPFVSHSSTSRAAAEAIDPSTVTLRDQVLQWIRDRGGDGATDEEIQLGLGINPSTERPRRRELQQAGFIVDSGQVRRTRSRRDAVVWVAIRGEPLAVPPPGRNERREAYLQAGRAFAQACREGRPREERQELARAVLNAAQAAF